jgi:alpha,alpha-trehalose phosphorylase
VTRRAAYGWSSLRTLPALQDQVVAALAAARHTGWAGLRAEQRRYLDEFWASADVEIDGDLELQQAVRFALFHTLQAGARAEQRAIGAKGLTGPVYDGHTFWGETLGLRVDAERLIPRARAGPAARARWSRVPLRSSVWARQRSASAGG